MEIIFDDKHFFIIILLKTNDSNYYCCLWSCKSKTVLSMLWDFCFYRLAAWKAVTAIFSRVNKIVKCKSVDLL